MPAATSLLDLPDMALLRVLELLLPPPRAALGCCAHRPAVRDALALSRACARLRALWARCALRAREYRLCPSCAGLPARAAAVSILAALLRPPPAPAPAEPAAAAAGRRPADISLQIAAVRLGEVGPARAGLVELMCAVRCAQQHVDERDGEGDALRLLDMSAVENPPPDELLHMLCAIERRIRYQHHHLNRNDSHLRDLRLWVGSATVLQAVQRSGIAPAVEALTLCGLPRGKLQRDGARALRDMLRDVTRAEKIPDLRRLRKLAIFAGKDGSGRPTVSGHGVGPFNLDDVDLQDVVPLLESENPGESDDSDAEEEDIDEGGDPDGENHLPGQFLVAPTVNVNQTEPNSGLAVWGTAPVQVALPHKPLSHRLWYVVASSLPSGLEEMQLGIPRAATALLRADRLQPGCAVSLRDILLADTLDVTSVNVAKLVAGLPALRTVALRRCLIRQVSIRSVLTTLGPRLVELFDCYRWRTADELACAARHCPNIARISLACAREFDQGNAWQLMPSYPDQPQPLDDAVVALCRTLSPKLVKLKIDDWALSPSALQLAVTEARMLESLAVQWTQEPHPCYHYWMLLRKSQLLRSLFMYPVGRSRHRGAPELWTWSAAGIVNVTWYCRRYCPNLEVFGLVTPTLPVGEDSNRVWRALDLLSRDCPLVCTALAKSKLYFRDRRARDEF